MNLRSHTRVLVALTLVATAVSGCSDNSEGAAATTVPGAASSSSKVTKTPGVDDRTPLTVYLDSLYGLSGSTEEQQQQRTAKLTRQEQLIAACMKQAGFEYIPVPVVETPIGQVGPSDEDLDSPDWVGKYGYGLIETPDGKTSGGSPDGQVKEVGSDPNHAYNKSLTESERVAYSEAMYGKVEDQSNDLNLIEDWQKMGCFGAAQHEVGVGLNPFKTAEGKSFEPTLNDFYNGWTRWPGMSQLQAAWASCMSGKGYAGYHRQADALQEVGARIDAARNADGDWKASADVPALVAKERKVAMIDLNCRVETHFRSTYRSITVAAETKFMKDNAAALDALKASMEQAGHR